MNLLSILEHFFSHTAPLSPGDGVVVGFSGGPDSTALLLGLARLARGTPLTISAVHLDHGLDAGSTARAEAAARLAARIGVPLRTESRDVPALCRSGESLEVAARRVRYALLFAVRDEIGARFVATAHHRDDQAETVLLRLLFGSGLAGLAGIPPLAGALVRPLLAAPRSALLAAVREAGLEPVEDPTNDDLGLPRNRLRHRILPALSGADPEFPARLARLAARAAGAGRRIEAVADARLSPRSAGSGRVSISWCGFAELPEALRPFALAALHRRAGAPYPASGPARAELLRQLTRPGAVGCDCGGGWRWEGRGDRTTGRLLLLPPPGGERRRAVPSGFTYTLPVPGVGSEVTPDGA
jgi:tRNA(Ile)-lysidine synthase